MKIQKIFLWILMVALVTGCATGSKHISKDVSKQDNAVQVWMNQAAGLEVMETYANAHALYVKFRAFLKDSDQSKVFFGRAVWDEIIQKNAQAFVNLEVPLEFIEQTLWESRLGHLTPVKSLPSAQWQVLRKALIHDITPDAKNVAALVKHKRKKTLFYYDENNQLVVAEFKSKPQDIKVGVSYTQNEISEKIVSALRDITPADKGNLGGVFITTLDEEIHLNPFLYVNLDQQFFVNLKIQDMSQKKYSGSLLKKGLKTFDHFILGSHVLGLVKRPVSSVYRLFSWTKDTAYGVMNPSTRLFMERQPVPPLYQGEAMDLEVWEQKLDKLLGKKSSSGTMNFLIDGEEFFPRLIETIKNAQKSIHVRTFIFDNDDYAIKIADLLKEKSKEEGVDVKVLLDGMGQIMGEGKSAETLPAGFTPPDSIARYLTQDSNVQVRVRPNTWFKSDHIKTTVIDNKICFTGGMNIGREYRYDWHDMMMQVQGSVLEGIIQDFHNAWAHASALGDIGYLASVMKRKNVPNLTADSYAIRALYTMVNDPQIYKAQLAAINEAKKYIYIHNAYFSDNAILYALIQARRRGVDVRVVLPVNGNHEIMNQSNILTANIMLRNGIQVFFYPGMSHIKAAVYDGWLCTGSANFDRLSLRDNLELNLATSDSQTVKRFEEMLFEKDFEKSMKMIEPLKSGLREHLAEFLANQL